LEVVEEQAKLLILQVLPLAVVRVALVHLPVVREVPDIIPVVLQGQAAAVPDQVPVL
jgi:hypothetical protein